MAMEEIFEVRLPQDANSLKIQPTPASPVPSSPTYRDTPVDLRLATGESPWTLSAAARGQDNDNALIRFCNTVNDMLQQEGILEVSTRWETNAQGTRGIVFDMEFVRSTDQAEGLCRRLWARLEREGVLGDQKIDRFSNRLANRIGIDFGLPQVRAKNHLLIQRRGLHPRAILYKESLRPRRPVAPTQAWVYPEPSAR